MLQAHQWPPPLLRRVVATSAGMAAVPSCRARGAGGRGGRGGAGGGETVDQGGSTHAWSQGCPAAGPRVRGGGCRGGWGVGGAGGGCRGGEGAGVGCPAAGPGPGPRPGCPAVRLDQAGCRARAEVRVRVKESRRTQGPRRSGRSLLWALGGGQAASMSSCRRRQQQHHS